MVCMYLCLELYTCLLLLHVLLWPLMCGSLYNVSRFDLSPDFDANNIFKAFFGGPGGFSFEGSPCRSRRLCSCASLHFKHSQEFFIYFTHLVLPLLHFSVCTRKLLLPVWLIIRGDLIIPEDFGTSSFATSGLCSTRFNPKPALKFHSKRPPVSMTTLILSAGCSRLPDDPHLVCWVLPSP